MSSYTDDYLDGNAAAGELSNIFSMDITAANVECAHCGTTEHFAEAHLYTQCPGFVARCPACQQVIFRLVHARDRMLLDMSGMTYLSVDNLDHGRRLESSEPT